MAERPIIFGSPMVQALLDGRKSQTRRIVARANSTVDGTGASKRVWEAVARGFDRAWVDPGIGAGPHLKVPWEHPDSPGDEMVCRVRPRVEVGDVLWVRETWGCREADHPKVPDGRKPRRGDKTVYRADPADAWQWRDGSLPWRPSIFMPRWASRLSRRVAEVRIERVQAISEEDARAEGVTTWRESGRFNLTNRAAFALLWDDINGKRPGCSWEASRWVFMYRLEALDG